MVNQALNKEALDKMTRARTHLLIEQPFFGTLAMRLKLVEDTSAKTLRVDGKTVQYNPTFVNSLNNDLAKSALAHEVMHCVLDHVGASGRGISLNPEKWNYAADYAVNSILQESGFKLGDGWLYDPQYKGMTAEHIYSLIPTPPPQPQGGAGSNGKGPSAGAPGPLDDISPGSPDPAMQAQDAAEWKVATVQSANAAKAVGKLSQGLEQFVEQIVQNKVDWRAELREFIVQASKNDYSWQRPNRKMLAAGYYLPGLHSETMGSVVIASDESGSVDKAITEAFGAEITSIMQDLRPETITVMHFDTEVRKTETFGPDDKFELTRFCSGGTDFRPAIEAAQEMSEPPMCMIYLTDLYGPFPTTPPEFPVLWVCINKLQAPFGRTIPIEI